MRAVGLDLGERRIGVAVSDAGGVLASPRAIVERSGDAERAWTEIETIVRECAAEVLVVGLPLSLDGEARDAARHAIEQARQLGERIGIAVEVQDERLTTALAIRLRHESTASRGRSQGRKTRRPRREAPGRRFDAEAAALILQSWLDARRTEP